MRSLPRTMLLLLLCMYLSACGAGDPISSGLILEHSYSVRDPQFHRAMEGLFRSPAVGGNVVTTLVDAPQIYPSMLDAIKSARRSICLEMYTLWSGEAADEFVAALSERAASGVPTLLIYDDAGSSRLDGRDVETMQNAGVRVVRYNPVEKVLLVFTAPEVNHRTHRKLLIVDGRIGFIGGVGIADLWLGHEDDGVPWRDTMYRIEGPVVANMQGGFMGHWTRLAKELPHSDAFFPSLEPLGDAECQIVTSSPEDGYADMEMMYLLAISAAERSIDIATPYFVPDDLMIDAMCKARQRGVVVKIIVPGPHMDQEIVRDASHALWDKLLNAGVEIHEYQPTMCHYKIMVIDALWTSVGSANLDPRSLRLSDEANLNVYGADFAAQHIRLLEGDLKQCKRITEVEHVRRGMLDRLRELFASLFKPQL